MFYWTYAILILFGISWFIYYAYMTLKTGVPGMVLNRKALNTLKEYLDKNDLIQDKYFYELGSALGDVCFMAESLQAKHVVGYELSPVYVYWAQLRAKIRKSQVHFYRKDFFNVDLSQADVLYIWLVPGVSECVWTKVQ